MSAFGAELVAVVPWDDDARGLPSRFVDHPRFSWGEPEHTRRVRAPVRVRVDPAGGLHLGGDGAGIVHLAGGRTPLAASVDDFACTADGACAVLEAGRLRALDADGRERWSADGDFGKVLSAADRLYVAGPGGLTELDAASGRTRRTLSHGGGEPFLGGGRILSVVYDEARGVRGIEALDPDGGATTRFDEAHHAWLAHPFGADGRARLYAWRDGEVARIGPEGAIEVLGAVEGIAVAGGAVFTSRSSEDGVVVAGRDGEIALAAPPGFRLIAVDPLRLMGGEAPDSPGEARTYRPDGSLGSAAPPPQDLAAIDCRVPVPGAWQVDPGGRVVVPVVTPEGVAVVRLASRPGAQPPGGR